MAKARKVQSGKGLANRSQIAINSEALMASLAARSQGHQPPDRKAQTDLRNVVLRESGYNAHSRCNSVEGCGSREKFGPKLGTGAEFQGHRGLSPANVTSRTDKLSYGAIVHLS